MSERLSSTDVSFFYLEGRTTPQHVGGIAVFAPPADGFDYDRLVRLLEERISLVPRYRQKMRAIPAHLANPVWVDDPNFDITYHVRRSALPRPGTQAQLLEFCARIQSRLLDRTRPLWEMYLVEGLTDGQIAIVTKTHHAMVDEVGAIDIGQVILDSSPEPQRTVEALWMPEPEPSATGLLLEALAGFAHRPAAVVDAVRLGIKDVRASTGRVTSLAGTALSTALALVRRAPSSPLTVRLGQQRRIAVARTRLDDYRQVRQAHGGTVNEVALATVAGALRGWLLQRGEAVAPSLVVRALVPVSVSGDGPGHVTPLLVDLPVGEPSPLHRLALIGTAMAEHQRSGRSVSADALVSLSGFAPPTLHGLGSRASKGLTRRMFSLVVTNVPGPQLSLYAAGARMTEMFPILPLGPGQALSIGITSYDGGVFYGVNGDRDAMPDIDVLAALIEESLAELVDASPVAAARSAAALGRVGRLKPASRRPAARVPRGSRS
ncbi:MAG: diacylglycerol O-acyltransferase / wax synthase [Pseudonocardiales bacterium]|jgi:WS/DGAT/MGAT family acyltransferase|nr:diacylglycerol O-acyltransferase / wax synthase [Pseudonocardiales bacterium]